MARTSPFRTVTVKAVQEYLEVWPDMQTFLMNLYAMGVLDGRHAQATGETSPAPFDEPLF